MNWHRTRVALVFVALSLLAGAVGTIATIPNIPTWYAGLAKPAFNPPSWIFGPVWNTLYIMMGVAASLVWRSKKPGSRKAIALFLAHLVVNAAWSFVFFGLHMLALSVAVIVLLWLMILALIVAFSKYSRPAAMLLAPYLLWVTFASVLNVSILILN